ncbi:sugar phosphate nucleotidyltransferase [Bacteroidota bacterium]
MDVQKAVITAAGPNQRKLPLQTLIDKEGFEKSFLELLIEEVLAAGINDICIVVQPGDELPYGQVIGEHAHNVTFVHQKKPLGYGHALHCAHLFTGRDAFLHLVGDHLYVNRTSEACARHLVEFAGKNECAVSTVQPTRESLITNFGVVGGKRLQGVNDVYQIETVIEKPTPTEAEQKLLVPGLRAGHYLCFFGMHVLTPSVMDILGKEIGENEKSNLSVALNKLSQTEQYLALEKNDLRYDMGEKYGLLKAQLALALYGKDRDRILNELVEFFALKDE